MLRHLVVVVDASAAMLASDLPPSRLVATCMALKDFTKEWFDQNPVGSLSVVAVRSGMGHVLSPLTATPKHITDPLDALGGQAEHRGRSGTSATTSAAVTAMCGGGPVLDGSFSFQAALETATHELSLVPTQAGREVLIVHGALSSVDAGDIWRTVEGMQGTTVHVIGLSGEVFVARRIAEVRARVLLSAPAAACDDPTIFNSDSFYTLTPWRRDFCLRLALALSPCVPPHPT